MATVLEKYRMKMEQCSRAVSEQNLPLWDVAFLQELGYRICVLEAFQAFCMTAPVTTDTNALVFHYKMVDTYVQFLLEERKVGLSTDEEGKKKRETAMQSLKSVTDDFRRRFCSFRASDRETYRKSISALINAVLPVWAQYRDTLIKL